MKGLDWGGGRTSTTALFGDRNDGPAHLLYCITSIARSGFWPQREFVVPVTRVVDKLNAVAAARPPVPGARAAT